MTYELVQLPYGRLHELENIWVPFVAAFAARQQCSLEQRLADIYSGQIALILIWNKETNSPQALIAWSIMQRDTDRTINIVWISGTDMKGWLHLYDDLERLFKSYGPAEIEIIGRWGWWKFLKSKGFRRTQVQYRKALDNGT